MKKTLISSGLLVVVGLTGCASEEAWLKRRDAIRQHAAEQSQTPENAPQNAESEKPAQPSQG